MKNSWQSIKKGKWRNQLYQTGKEHLKKKIKKLKIGKTLIAGYLQETLEMGDRIFPWIGNAQERSVNCCLMQYLFEDSVPQGKRRKKKQGQGPLELLQKAGRRKS